jgi:hypothetical protein
MNKFTETASISSPGKDLLKKQAKQEKVNEETHYGTQPE